MVGKLARGLAAVARSKGVEVVGGQAVFEGSRELRVEGEAPQKIRFRHAIVATGSRADPAARRSPSSSERLMDSTAALALADVPERLLVIGGGYIGLELGQVYAALGSAVTLVEMTDGLLPGVDRDLVQPLARQCERAFAAVHLGTRVTALREVDGGDRGAAGRRRAAVRPRAGGRGPPGPRRGPRPRGHARPPRPSAATSPSTSAAGPTTPTSTPWAT